MPVLLNGVSSKLLEFIPLIDWEPEIQERLRNVSKHAGVLALTWSNVLALEGRDVIRRKVYIGQQIEPELAHVQTFQQALQAAMIRFEDLRKSLFDLQAATHSCSKECRTKLSVVTDELEKKTSELIVLRSNVRSSERRIEFIRKESTEAEAAERIILTRSSIVRNSLDGDEEDRPRFSTLLKNPLSGCLNTNSAYFMSRINAANTWECYQRACDISSENNKRKERIQEINVELIKNKSNLKSLEKVSQVLRNRKDTLMDAVAALTNINYGFRESLQAIANILSAIQDVNSIIHKAWLKKYVCYLVMEAFRVFKPSDSHKEELDVKELRRKWSQLQSLLQRSAFQ
ncbi:hypothetical protein CHS0354_024335 [Potamilus streckersoni]|uniref:Uncharacterized protein n=1 Tax=Potamilus streckersoni TaxID=2493646 RepID=A0AAE0TII0_9BIVA|nr:hypothetical protein CHS0354_024335 [Potamilus streckersoni]